jgi:hypothetical protein
MNLGELRKMIAKLPPDMDELHVMLVTAVKGERIFDLMTAVGHIPLPDNNMTIALVGYEEIKRQVMPTGLTVEPPTET